MFRPNLDPVDMPIDKPDPTQDLLSIVIPVYNEEGNVQRLVERIEQEMDKAHIRAELIVVDDGSTDRSLAYMKQLQQDRDWIRLLHRPKPMGQSAAISAGIAVARGTFIATLDADLQNDPADLPTLLDVLHREGADMAQGFRHQRQDTPVRKFSSWIGRTARRLILGDTIRDTGCSTRMIKADFAKQLPLQYAGMHRFMPAYARILGATVVEVPVAHHPRDWGISKYGMGNRALVGLIDCFALRWMRNRLRRVQCEPVETTCQNTSTDPASDPPHQPCNQPAS